jgi:hypothetical protein
MGTELFPSVLFSATIAVGSPNNRIKTDARKRAEALRGKVIGPCGLCGALRYGKGTIND